MLWHIFFLFLFFSCLIFSLKYTYNVIIIFGLSSKIYFYMMVINFPSPTLRNETVFIGGVLPHRFFHLKWASALIHAVFFFLSNLDVNVSIFLQSLHYILTGSLNKLPWNVPHELLKRMSFRSICSSELTVCFHIVANSELFLSQKIKENLIPYDIWPLLSHDQFESLHGDISCKRTKL